MRILVLGAGRMGLGAAHDLAAQPDVEEVTVADVDLGRARAVAARIGHGRVTPVRLDATRRGDVLEVMRGHAAAISCVNYWLNDELARVAIEAGTNFCDLGGNNDVVAAELALDDAARRKGVSIIPDCGLAPGMVAMLAT
ncbi:MAG TPA: saccharopine dehydrogenase NADP-binding domain-containing protein, partial [Thermoanaerobaculia bacterium]|nr:saccharopine dehydrogenase NADP-binding domain-containing protein [Thermoanaerobaculia bacterium]